MVKNFMKIYHLLIVGTLIGSNLCNINKDKDREITLFDLKRIIIADTLKIDQTEAKIIWLNPGSYNPIYIGKLKDSIYVSYKPDLKNCFVRNYGPQKYKIADSTGILLVVDTTKIIPKYSMEWKDDRSELTLKSYKAFPVFFVNETKDTLYIGYGEHIPIIMEAVDKEGNWKPIEEQYIYMCGFGLKDIILPPNEMAVTSVFINNGKINTRLRLRYHNIMSQEFYGKINPTQFERGWDENWNPKPLPKE